MHRMEPFQPPGEPASVPGREQPIYTTPAHITLGLLRYAKEHRVPLKYLCGGETMPGYCSKSLADLKRKIAERDEAMAPFLEEFPDHLFLAGTISPSHDYRLANDWIKQGYADSPFKTLEDFEPMFKTLFDAYDWVWIYASSAAKTEPYNPANSQMYSRVLRAALDASTKGGGPWIHVLTKRCVAFQITVLYNGRRSNKGLIGAPPEDCFIACTTRSECGGSATVARAGSLSPLTSSTSPEPFGKPKACRSMLNQLVRPSRPGCRRSSISPRLPAKPFQPDRFVVQSGVRYRLPAGQIEPAVERHQAAQGSASRRLYRPQGWLRTSGGRCHGHEALHVFLGYRPGESRLLHGKRETRNGFLPPTAR